MKKILLILLLITSLHSAEKIYIGLNYGFYDESFNDENKAYSSSIYEKINIGYGNRESYAIEFSLEHLKNKSNIFSKNDSDKYGFNINLIKSFDLDIYVNPFFKFGIGTGYLEIDREIQNTLLYGSFNLGLGFFIPITQHFDFVLGYDYKYLSYEEIDTIANKINFKSNLSSAYSGFNLRF